MDKARTTTPAVRPALRRAAPLGDLARLGSESETERRVRAITPWVVSIMLHLGVIAVAVAVTFTMVQLREAPDPVLVIADFHALAHDPVRPLGEASGMPLPAGEEALPDPLEHPLADALAPQDDPVLALAPPAGGAAPAPATPIPVEVPATFAGLRASNARKVVYVVDASGSMIGTLPLVIDELARSLRSMVPQQEFAIIFFQRNQSLAVPPRDRLTPARPAEQAEAIRWIRKNVSANGRSNPLKAIEDALRLRPDVVFVLSNNITGSGQFEIEQSRLLDLLDRLNPLDPMSGQRRTQIQCIQFLDDDPLQTLRRIAEQHGGPDGYRFISRADLPGAAP